jgi:hypothetical protein
MVMSFIGLLNLSGVVTRRSDNVVDSISISPTLTIDRQPSESSYMNIKVSSTCGSGIVYITGLVVGVTTTEVKSFSSANVVRTSNPFTSIIGITTSGLLSTGNIEVVCRTLENTPIYQEVTAHSSFKCRISSPRHVDYLSEPGESEVDSLQMFSELLLLKGDKIAISSDTYEARTNSKSIYGKKQLHHYETDIEII